MSSSPAFLAVSLHSLLLCIRGHLFTRISEYGAGWPGKGALGGNPTDNPQRQEGEIHFIRYADDFLISGSSKELLEQEVKPVVEQFMRERGLSLSQEKTLITHIENGFDFLGQHVRKYNGKLLIKPAKENVQELLAKVRKIVKENKQTPAGKLIAQLNPIIRGWALYHRHVVSKRTFTAVDRAIFEMLWQWAGRRHPNKGRRWVKEKYFHEIGHRRWVFTGEVEGKKQEGKCPVCDQKVTKASGWHVHHIVYRVYGGTDHLSNLLLLHPNCHRQVHHQKLDVTKPGAETCLEEA